MRFVNFRRLFILTVILTFGFFLRYRAALLQDIWIDEATIFDVSRLPVLTLLRRDHWDTAHPQLYYLFLHFWMKLGTTPLFLRFPTLITSMTAGVVIYRIGKLVRNSRFGLLSVYLYSIHPFFVNLGFQQKMYGFVIFFTLLSFYSLLQMFKNEKENVDVEHYCFPCFGVLLRLFLYLVLPYRCVDIELFVFPKTF